MKHNNLKRVFAIFMIGAMMLAFSSCGQDEVNETPKDTDTKTAAKAESDSDEKTDKTKEDKKKEDKKEKEKTEKTSQKDDKKTTSSGSTSGGGNSGSSSGSNSGSNSGSSSGSGQTSSKEKSLSSIMSSILSGVDLPKVGNTTLDGDNFPSFAFIEKQEGYKGLASEAMVGSIAHSVVLVRVPEGASAKTVAASIKANADPRKWICVEAEKTIVKYHKRTVLLIMSDADTANAIAANFDALY